MDASEQAHYASYRSAGAAGASPSPLCEQFGVEVAWAGAERGKIVRTTRAAAAGDVLWAEDPLAGMAHLSSAGWRAGHACSRCLRPIGSLQAAWGRASQALLEEAAAARRKRAKKKGAAKSKSKKAVTAEDDAAPTEEQDASLQLELPAELPFLSHAAAVPSDPLTLHLPMADPVLCARGCSEALYCSAQCRDLDFAHSHELLCMGAAPSAAEAAASSSSSAAASASAAAKAHAALLKHAQSNNEIFMLAAQVMAHCMLRALREMQQLPTVQKLLGTSAQEQQMPAPEPLLPFAVKLYERVKVLCTVERNAVQSDLRSCVVRGCAPYDAFCGAVWWEHVAVPARIAAEGGEEEAEYRQLLCGVAERSLTLMHELAQAQVCAAASASQPSSDPAAIDWDEFASALCLDDVWSIDRMGRVLSSFERNNIGWAAPTTLGLYVAHVRALDAPRREQAVQQMGSLVWEALQRRCDGSAAGVSGDGAAGGAPVAAFGSVEGTGLFALGCCMNHSCDPNVTLRSKRALAHEERSVAERGHTHASEYEDEQQRSKLIQLMGAQAAAGGVAAAAAESSSTSRNLLPSSPCHHSAGPSVLLDRSALFVALRPLAAGEELNISYIELTQPQQQQPCGDGEHQAGVIDAAEEEVPLQTRREQLHAYGFVCRCAKCEREATQAESS